MMPQCSQTGDDPVCVFGINSTNVVFFPRFSMAMPQAISGFTVMKRALFVNFKV
jgi:hypothetical protein